MTTPLPHHPIGWQTIVADPPWPYDTRVAGKAALPSGMLKDGSRRQVTVSEWSYNPMSMDDLKALPVEKVVAKNAHLYLWTTNTFMTEAHELARAWGFKPVTIITWGKVKKDDPSQPSMKMGHWFRGATEHVVFATRGTLPKPSVALPTLFLHPRIAQHSAKPEAFYAEVVERVSPGPRLEMFSRTSRKGWTMWGNQAPDRPRPRPRQP